MLIDIEPDDARLADALPRVLLRRGFEGLDTLGLHVNVDMDDEQKTFDSFR